MSCLDCCCAPAASGCAKAAPPSKVMKSRRLISSPRDGAQPTISSIAKCVVRHRKNRPPKSENGMDRRADQGGWVKRVHRCNAAILCSLRLLDHLIGDSEHVGWHREAERLCGIEVDH